MANKTKEKKSLIVSVYEWVEVICVALFAVVMLFTFAFRLVTVDGPSMNKTLSHGDRLIISDLLYTPERGDVVVLQDTQSLLKEPIIKRVIATENEIVDINPETWSVTVMDKNGNVLKTLEEPYANRIYEYKVAFDGGETLAVTTDSDSPRIKYYDSSKRRVSPEKISFSKEENAVYVGLEFSSFNRFAVRIDTKNLTAKVIYPNGSEKAVNVEMQLEPMDLTSISGVNYPYTVPEGHVFVMGDNRNDSADSRYYGSYDERTILGKAYMRVFPNTTFDFKN